MSDKDTSECLKSECPPKSFEDLMKYKIEQKGLGYEEALEDIIRTASKTNEKVNKKFGL